MSEPFPLEPEIELPVAGPPPLSEEEEANLCVLKRKLRAYKLSYPADKFKDINWTALESDSFEDVEALYNEVLATINGFYNKGTGMVGAAYYGGVQAVETIAGMTGLVKLNGLTRAVSTSPEITDVLIQLNIEYGGYDSVLSPELRRLHATLNATMATYMINKQLETRPDHSAPQAAQERNDIDKLMADYADC